MSNEKMQVLREWQKGQRESRKEENMVCKRRIRNTSFCRFITNSELAKHCQKALREAELKIRVVEGAGQSSPCKI